MDEKIDEILEYIVKEEEIIKQENSNRSLNYLHIIETKLLIKSE